MVRSTREASGDLGRYAELLFQAEALKRGLVVYQPVQSYRSVDCVIGVHGKFFRVQVKASKRRGERKAYRFTSDIPFDASSFDILAGYTSGPNKWVFAHASDVAGRRGVNHTPNPNDVSGQASLFWTDWSIFFQAPFAPQLDALEKPLTEVTPELCLAGIG